MLKARVRPTFEKVAERFTSFKDSLRDFRTEFLSTLPILQESAREGLESQGASLQASWAPISAEWMRRKARMGAPTVAGIFRGRLLQELSSGGRGTAYRTRAQFGPTKKYAYVFNFGRSPGERRQFLGISANAEEKMHAVIKGGVDRRLEDLRAQLRG